MSSRAPTLTRYEHIELDADGVPYIATTTMKVIELAAAHLAHGWSSEELHFQHPYLTLGQIHSGLAYYWDHKAELDSDIARREEFADRLREEAGPSPLAARLRALDARSVAAIAYLQAKIARAPEDAETIRRADAELDSLQRHLNANRIAAGETPLITEGTELAGG